jgi:hypothetical protein
MDWGPIQYVTSGFTLAAFIASAIAWTFKRYADRERRLIQQAKEDDRAQLVSSALEFFHINTEGLTKEQKFHLALEQIHKRGERFRIGTMLVLGLAIISAVLTGFLLVQKSSGKSLPDSGSSSTPPQSLTPSQVLEAHLASLNKGQLHDETLSLSFELQELQDRNVQDSLAVNSLSDSTFRDNKSRAIVEEYKGEFRKKLLPRALVFRRELLKRADPGVERDYAGKVFYGDINSAMGGSLNFSDYGRTTMFGVLAEYFKDQADSLEGSRANGKI